MGAKREERRAFCYRCAMNGSKKGIEKSSLLPLCYEWEQKGDREELSVTVVL